MEQLKPCPFCGGEAAISKWRPIIDLPPHGRLIDGDRFLEKLKRWRDYWSEGVGIASKAENLAYRQAIEDLENASTIIPAEGGEE